MVLSNLLAVTIYDGNYDAREREGFRQVASLFEIPWNQVTVVEDRLAEELRKAPLNQEPNWKESPEETKRRRWKIVVAAVAAGVAAVAFTPLLAPAIGGAIGSYGLGLSGAAATSAGLSTLGGGSVAAGGWGVAGGTATIASTLSLTSAGLIGRKVARRIGPVDEFRYGHLGGEGMHCFIAVPGFLSERVNPKRVWGELPSIAGHGRHYALVWESQYLYDIGAKLVSVGMRAFISRMVYAFARHASRAAARTFLWPASVLESASIIDSPWAIAKNRAEKAALLLAEDLRERYHGNRPVTLIGFSLGARLIFYALEKLAEAEDKAKGIVDHVILMGGAYSADNQRWEKVRNIVSGRLVNAYSSKDWVLGFIYRAAELEFGHIAGLHPVRVQDIENIDVGHIVSGHGDYMKQSGRLLSHIGVDGR
jgi:hypothetical protein